MTAKRKPTQPRKARKASEPIRYADTLTAAASMLKCDVGLLKSLRAGGSTAFVHGRVNLEQVKVELAAMPPPDTSKGLEDKQTLERRKLRAQYLKEEFRLEVAQRKHIPIDEVHADMIRIGNATRAECLRLLADAPGWVGLDESAISQRVTDWMTTLCTTLSDDMSKLYK
jgi:hypothetical protein